MLSFQRDRLLIGLSLLTIEDYRTRKEGVILKINLEKVYDHVDWNFLDRILTK